MSRPAAISLAHATLPLRMTPFRKRKSKQQKVGHAQVAN